MKTLKILAQQQNYEDAIVALKKDQHDQINDLLQRLESRREMGFAKLRNFEEFFQIYPRIPADSNYLQYLRRPEKFDGYSNGTVKFIDHQGNKFKFSANVLVISDREFTKLVRLEARKLLQIHYAKLQKEMTERRATELQQAERNFKLAKKKLEDLQDRTELTAIEKKNSNLKKKILP